MGIAMEYTNLLNLDEVRLPLESTGICKYYKKCKNFDVPLGNGICMLCWDKGLDGGGRANVYRSTGRYFKTVRKNSP